MFKFFKKEGSSEQVPPQFSFWLGLLGGVAVVSFIGFLVILGLYVKSPKDTTKDLTGNTSPVRGQTGTSQIPPPSSDISGRVNVPVSSSDHIRGNPNAPVTIVEFSDFQCPYCQRFHPTMQQVLSSYGDQVRWVYKHFPLDSIHPNARPAAIASECVAALGGNNAFWQFADGLFANQDQLGNALYLKLAKQVGVNESKFKSCYDAKQYASRVEGDYQLGIQLGVRGTPGNFVNGIPVAGAVPFEQIKQVIDSELK